MAYSHTWPKINTEMSPNYVHAYVYGIAVKYQGIPYSGYILRIQIFANPEISASEEIVCYLNICE